MRLPVRFRRKLSAPRAEVFRQVTDYEKLKENFPSLFISVRVLERSRNGAVTEEKFSVLGTVIEQRSRHVARAPKTHEVEILTGDLRGSKLVETYSVATHGGTIVEVEGDFVLGGFLSLLPQFIVRPLVEENLGRIFAELEARRP